MTNEYFIVSFVPGSKLNEYCQASLVMTKPVFHLTKVLLHFSFGGNN